MINMKVSIVIPNWNGVEKLKKNLPRVLKVRGVDEVIVSDDASTDGSVELLKSQFPQVKLVVREKNGGFASNVNTGVKASSGELAFLLNTDTVPEEDCLRAILPHFKDPKVFSVGPSTGGSWSWAKFKNGFFWHYMTPASQGQALRMRTGRAHQTLWVSGGSGVFRRSIWDKLGGLDEIYNPFYEEDVDLGYRAIKRGYINSFEPNSYVEHYKQTGVITQHFSQQTISQIAQRNQLLFIWKNITSVKLIRQHQTALIKILLIHPKYWAVFLKALTHLPAVLQKRGIEKKEAILTDEEILAKFKI